jgi:sortase (surface protein transpeptidase)
MSVAVALMVVSGLLIGFSSQQGDSDAGTPSPAKVVSADRLIEGPPDEPTAMDSRTTVDSARLPVRITISAIGVAANVSSLGRNADRTVEVPKDPNDAGWYSEGPPPGANGSAVILGHVDSKTGPAVFYRLNHLKPGDRIAVELADSTVAHNRVARVAQNANKDFPAVKVYAGSRDRPALNLVTCGGTYDRAAGGYQSNVVVYSTFIRASGGPGRVR